MGDWYETDAITGAPIAFGESCYAIRVRQSLVTDGHFSDYYWIETKQGNYDDYGGLVGFDFDYLHSPYAEYEGAKPEHSTAIFVLHDVMTAVSGYCNNIHEFSSHMADVRREAERLQASNLAYEKLFDKPVDPVLKRIKPLEPFYSATLAVFHFAFLARIGLFSRRGPQYYEKESAAAARFQRHLSTRMWASNRYK